MTELAQESESRVILIDKPLEWTSFDVVKKVRAKLGIKKIGHAGTLDPLATGLLILCTGKMTKRIEEFQGMEKEYRGKMILGQTTPSYDLETPVSKAVPIAHITQSQIKEAALQLTGNIQQVPPLHSAIKVEGKRAYKLARAGSDTKLKAREVTVTKFQITNVSLPEITFEVTCSKGTYIRSLAHDLGEILGVGAYLSELCRTRIGIFELANAQSLDQLEK